MASMPVKHGFAPKRWQKCIDAILEKIPGQPRIKKLRIIMLYEADFNYVRKIIWGRRLVRHTEMHNCLSEENHGSRNTLTYRDETAAAVAHHINANTSLSGGTNGGLLNGLGTFGFVWANYSSSQILMNGKGQVPGHTYGMSSTRTELYGILAALTYLNLDTTYHHLVPNQAKKECTI
jgi:hypothetical protein